MGIADRGYMHAGGSGGRKVAAQDVDHHDLDHCDLLRGLVC